MNLTKEEIDKLNSHIGTKQDVDMYTEIEKVLNEMMKEDMIKKLTILIEKS